MDIKIRKHIRSKNDEGVNDYIEQLENYISSLKASNTNQLIFKLDELNGAIVDDLQKIIDDEAFETRVIDGEAVEVSKLKLLNDSKDSKVFDRVMTLFTKLKDLKSVADHVASLIPEVEDEAVEVPKVKVEKGKNVFESLSAQVKGGK